jgi:WD40 repeat protein
VVATALAISQDGDRLVTGDAEGLTLLWDISGEGVPRVVASIPLKSKNRVTAVAFAGERLLVASEAGGIRIFDREGRPEPRVIEHRKYGQFVDSMSVSSGQIGRLLAIVCNNPPRMEGRIVRPARSKVVLWNLEGDRNGELVLASSPEPVAEGAASPKGEADKRQWISVRFDKQSRLVALREDGLVQVWDLPGPFPSDVPEPVLALRLPDERNIGVPAAAMLRDLNGNQGRELVTLHPSAIHRWTLDAEQGAFRNRGMLSSNIHVVDVAISPEDRLALTASRFSGLKAWRLGGTPPDSHPVPLGQPAENQACSRVAIAPRELGSGNGRRLFAVVFPAKASGESDVLELRGYSPPGGTGAIDFSLERTLKSALTKITDIGFQQGGDRTWLIAVGRRQTGGGPARDVAVAWDATNLDRAPSYLLQVDPEAPAEAEEAGLTAFKVTDDGTWLVAGNALGYLFAWNLVTAEPGQDVYSRPGAFARNDQTLDPVVGIETYRVEGLEGLLLATIHRRSGGSKVVEWEWNPPENPDSPPSRLFLDSVLTYRVQTVRRLGSDLVLLTDEGKFEVFRLKSDRPQAQE